MNSLLRKLAFPTAFTLASAAALLSIVHFTSSSECTEEPASPPTVVELFAAPAPIVATAVPAAVEDQHSVIKRADLDALFSDPQHLETQVRVMPSLKDGEFRGFKVYGIRPDSLPKQIGFKNGDLIKSVGGLAMTSQEAGLIAVRHLRDATAVDLDVERKGQPLRLHVTIE